MPLAPSNPNTTVGCWIQLIMHVPSTLNSQIQKKDSHQTTGSCAEATFEALHSPRLPSPSSYCHGCKDFRSRGLYEERFGYSNSYKRPYKSHATVIFIWGGGGGRVTKTTASLQVFFPCYVGLATDCDYVEYCSDRAVLH